MTRHRRLLLGGMLAATALATVAGTASAHPLGNFTINHSDGIRVSVDSVLVDHVVDMAEIPTFRERAAMDTDGDGDVSATEAAAYQALACDPSRVSLDLRMGGTVLPLTVTQTGLTFPEGQGALTTRLVCVFESSLPVPVTAAVAGFSFRDSADADRIGWREVVVQGDGTTISDSDAPAASTSERLTHYPTDLLSTPAAQTSATWGVVAGGPPLAAFQVPDASPVGSAATDPATMATAAVPGGISELGGDVAAVFQARELTPIAILIALLVAAGLGALHAASPGHGKTVMAAYLVGSRGTTRQALGLGMTVTLSHTLGVLALGALSLFASSVIAPERLYPILGTVSGAIVIAIGGWLVIGRLRIIRRERADARAHAAAHAVGTDHHHEHEHEHEHEHIEVDGWHSHGGVRHTHLPPAGSSLSMRGLFALGLAGGMVPSASAIILLLGSIALGRPAFGIALTVAFGVGMSVVLVGVGVLLVHGRGLLARVPSSIPTARIGRALPTATAFVVLGAGLLITTQAAMTLR